jgi:iron(III) transport system substrate-binding protein
MISDFAKFALFSLMPLLIFAACSTETEVITVEKEVVVTKEVLVEVPTEVVVTKEVLVEVPTEVVVTKEVITERIVEKEEEELVIYSGRSESLVGPIIEEFSILTGIPVAVKYGKTGAMVSLLLEEGSKTPADIFYAQDPGGLGAVESMLAPMSREVCNLIPEWAVAPKESDNSCKWIGITGRARVLVYNPEVLSADELPTSMEDLTDSKWKGKLGWAPSNGSFQAMITGMRINWGE